MLGAEDSARLRQSLHIAVISYPVVRRPGASLMDLTVIIDLEVVKGPALQITSDAYCSRNSRFQLVRSFRPTSSGLMSEAFLQPQSAFRRLLTFHTACIGEL